MTERERGDRSLLAGAGLQIDPKSGFATRVKVPTQNDWYTLQKMLGFLKGTKGLVSMLDADLSGVIVWQVEVTFAVHASKNDFLSNHAGGVFDPGVATTDSIDETTCCNPGSGTADPAPRGCVAWRHW